MRARASVRAARARTGSAWTDDHFRVASALSLYRVSSGNKWLRRSALGS